MKRNVWIILLLVVVFLAAALQWDGSSLNEPSDLDATPGNELDLDEGELPDERLNWIYMGGGLVLMIVPWIWYVVKRKAIDADEQK